MTISQRYSLEQFTLELSFADNKCLNGKAYLIDRYYNRCDWLFWILWLQVCSNVNCSKEKERQTSREQGLLYSYIDPAIQRYNEQSEDEQASFKASLTAYIKLYSYISHIMPFADIELEKLFIYGRFLLKKLPYKKKGGIVYLDDDVALEFYRLMKVKDQQAIYLSGEDYEVSSDIKVGDGKSVEDEKAHLSELISDVNELFGDIDFQSADKLFFDQITDDLSVNDTIKAQAENNTKENFKYGVNDAVLDAVIGRMSKNEKVAKAFLDNEKFRNYIIENVIVPDLYNRLNVENGHRFIKIIYQKVLICL